MPPESQADREKLVTSFIEANDRQFREQLKPGTLVRLSGMSTKYDFYHKDQTLQDFKALGKGFSLKDEQIWYKYFKPYNFLDWGFQSNECIMLLKSEPKWIAVPSKAWKESFSTYSQIWEVLWEERIGFLRIKMELGDSVEKFLEIMEDV